MHVEEGPEKELKALWDATGPKVLELYDGLQFHTALEDIFKFIAGVNRYAEVRAPWKLAKSESAEDRKLLETSLAVMAEGLRLASVLLAPVIPSTSRRIEVLLGLPEVMAFEGQLDWSDCLKGNTLGEKVILFPRPELAKA